MPPPPYPLFVAVAGQLLQVALALAGSSLLLVV